MLAGQAEVSDKVASFIKKFDFLFCQGNVLSLSERKIKSVLEFFCLESCC